MNKDYITTPPLKVLRITDKAILFQLPQDEETMKPFWIPKSQIEEPDVDTLHVGDEEEIMIPIWLADKVGL
jgi:hypothetical protein